MVSEILKLRQPVLGFRQVLGWVAAAAAALQLSEVTPGDETLLWKGSVS